MERTLSERRFGGDFDMSHVPLPVTSTALSPLAYRLSFATFPEGSSLRTTPGSEQLLDLCGHASQALCHAQAFGKYVQA